MPVTTITYTDKEQGQINPNPIEKKFIHDDANEVKTVVNNNAAELITAQSDISTNATNIGLRAIKDGDESLRAYRPIWGSVLSASSLLSDLQKNTFFKVDTTLSVTITVDDLSTDDIGTEYEFAIFTHVSPLTFATSGSQTIISSDLALSVDKKGGGCILKKTAANEWFLIGSLS